LRLEAIINDLSSAKFTSCNPLITGC